ncbi:hypothetical protein CRE_17196 [Caenorhabditis remanei]|uniref:Uncharacterized protein n=1 Tax=Caenorhabditis remanei TaxID=31234 RepID=E3MA02_CAERE|nr:hypothetical protein CRE_17196 [Caenorhabditis remanei]
MTMLLFIFLATRFMITVQQNIAECVPRCELIKMEANVVPTQYNRCVCDLIVENGELENLSNQELKCTPNYRSLKFRDRDTGAVVLHKAVVGICNGLNSREYVNQSQFDVEEQEFRLTRNFRVASASSTSSVQPAFSQKHSWIDGFRSNIMQLYRKPDGHLRFG